MPFGQLLRPQDGNLQAVVSRRVGTSRRAQTLQFRKLRPGTHNLLLSIHLYTNMGIPIVAYLGTIGSMGSSNPEHALAAELEATNNSYVQ